MHQLFIALAKLTPEETLLSDLETAIQNYKAENTKETKAKLQMQLMLLSGKFSFEGKDLGDAIQHFEEKKKAMEFFNGSKS